LPPLMVVAAVMVVAAADGSTTALVYTPYVYVSYLGSRALVRRRLTIRNSHHAAPPSPSV
jgi:hypothetical protein